VCVKCPDFHTRCDGKRPSSENEILSNRDFCVGPAAESTWTWSNVPVPLAPSTCPRQSSFRDSICHGACNSMGVCGLLMTAFALGSSCECHQLFFFHKVLLESLKKKNLFDIVHFKQTRSGVPVVAQWKRTQLGSVRMRVPSLASLRGLRIQRCHELWCKSQMWLRSRVAVAVA